MTATNPPARSCEVAPTHRIEPSRFDETLVVRVARWFGLFVLRFLLKPFTVFKIGGVPVQFHSTCVVIPLWMMTQVSPFYPFSYVLMISLVFFGLFYFSLLVHEFGHVWTARMFGIPTRRVIILPIAAFALLKSMPRGIREFWITAAGPLANLILAGILWLIAQPIDVRSHISLRRLEDVFLLVAHLNLVMALYNLLPCHPLDGGRMLRSLLTVFIKRWKGCGPDQAYLLATKIAVRYVAWLVALGMIAVTVFKTQFWFDAALFSIVMAFGEAEYWLLRTEPSSEVSLPDSNTQKFSSTSRRASSNVKSSGRKRTTQANHRRHCAYQRRMDD